MRFVNRSRTAANICTATTEPTPTEPATLYHQTTDLRPVLPFQSLQSRTSTNPLHPAALPGHDSSEKSSKWTLCSVATASQTTYGFHQLPTEVRVTYRPHPLFGHRLKVVRRRHVGSDSTGLLYFLMALTVPLLHPGPTNRSTAAELDLNCPRVELHPAHCGTY